MRRRHVAMFAVLALGACGGGGGRISVRGGMSVTPCDGSNSIACTAADQVQQSRPEYAVGQSCTTGSGGTGVAGLDDITAGAQVTVKNEKGAVVASGRLENGVYGPHLACRFPFSLSVPDAKFYSVEVAHRGAQTFSRSELNAKSQAIELTLVVPTPGP